MNSDRPTFGQWCRNRVATVAMFGDSITVGMGATRPERAWASLFGGRSEVQVNNRGISGTVLQGSADSSGQPRPENGLSRVERDLLAEPAEAICILYGYNDARYTAAPQEFNSGFFLQDYRTVIHRLLDGGFDRQAIAIGSPPYPSTAGFSIGGLGFTGQTRIGFEAYVTAVRTIASEFQLAYAPVYEMMAEHPDSSLASSDVTHPNDEGHRIIAEAFENACLKK